VSDKQNFAKSIIDAWQDSIQNLIKDKQFVDLVIDNYAKFQEIVKTTTNDNPQTTAQRDNNSAVDELSTLRTNLAELEQRVASLEQSFARRPKNKSK
jgi:cell division septum initiation protein DivIVA